MNISNRNLIMQAFVLINLITWAQISYSQSTFHDNQFLISFAPGTSQPDIDAVATTYNSVDVWASSDGEIHLFEVQGFPFTVMGNGNNVLADILEVVEDAEPRAEVDGINLNYKSELPSLAHERPRSFEGFSLLGCEGDDLIIEPGTNTINIAILDTGISDNLDPQSIFYNELFSGNYIGYDFVHDDDNPNDEHGHGNHIAGIISHFTDPGINYSYQIYKTHDEAGSGYLSNIVKALDRAIINDAHIINMSFGYYQDLNDADKDPLAHLINVAQRNGILIIAAAGNDNHDNDSDTRQYPASFRHDNILSVASVNCAHSLSEFSNYGEQTVDVASTGEWVMGPNFEGDAELRSGTSQACALATKASMQVASSLGLYDWASIKCRIIEGSTPLSIGSGQGINRGVVNTENAVNVLGCSSGSSDFGTRSREESTIDQAKIATLKDLDINILAGQILVQTSDHAPLDIILYDISGRLIGSYKGNSLDIEHLSTGIYFLTFRDQSSGEQITQRIFKD